MVLTIQLSKTGQNWFEIQSRRRINLVQLKKYYFNDEMSQYLTRCRIRRRKLKSGGKLHLNKTVLLRYLGWLWTYPQTRLERLVRGKHSSLIINICKLGRKVFIMLGPGGGAIN